MLVWRGSADNKGQHAINLAGPEIIASARAAIIEAAQRLDPLVLRWGR